MAKKGGAPTKSEIVATICKDSELSRKQVAAVFESLNGIIKKSLRGPGLFTLPGLLKMKVVKKPATIAGIDETFRLRLLDSTDALAYDISYAMSHGMSEVSSA